LEGAFDQVIRWPDRFAEQRARLDFPELAVTGARDADIEAATQPELDQALTTIRRAAKEARIYVACGLPWQEHGRRFNSAVVIGPDGSLLTRYSQLVVDRPQIFAQGSSTRAMWFEIKGVPCVVTIGRDALWSEIAEMAALRGAQLHLHLAYDQDTSTAGQLRRKQLWVNLASFRTVTATVNAASPVGLSHPSAPAGGGSAIWDDQHRGSSGKAGGYAPHSAVRLAVAKDGETILYATQKVPTTNPQFRILTEKTNPQMTAWYVAGAQAIHAESPTVPARAAAFPGRIAWSADGNHNDPDDWAASPVALAIFAEAGVKDRLVHFDYNCILPKTDPEWEKIHAASVLGAVKHYGYDQSLFHDCRKNLDAAVASITRAVNASSATDPLYFVVAGPMEVPVLGIRKADPDKRKFVYCISHSRWNDGFASGYTFTHTKRSVISLGVNWVQIQDQNPLLSTAPYGRPATQEEQWRPWHWMRDSDDSKVRFLWERMQVSTRPDPSDAGMAYFLVTGDEQADPAKLQRLLDDNLVPEPIRARAQVRLNVKSSATSASLRTIFNEPFTADRGRYEVYVRFFDEADHRGRYVLSINGVAQAAAWEAPGTGRGWTTETIRNVEIRRGDEIRLAVAGLPCRLDDGVRHREMGRRTRRNRQLPDQVDERRWEDNAPGLFRRRQLLRSQGDAHVKTMSIGFAISRSSVDTALD